MAGAAFLPNGLRGPVINRFMASQQRIDVLQDTAIWSRKQYRARPRLNRADGEIALFRDYCAQFYPDPGERHDSRPLSGCGATPSGTASRRGCPRSS